MKLSISLTICLLLSIAAKGQQQYDIHYRGTINGYGIHVRLLFNDSASFSFYYTSNEDPYKKKTVFDEKFKSPHNMFFTNNNFLWVARRGKRKLIVADTLKYNNWVMGSNTKTILGYKCNSAYSVGGEGDTVFVFYSTELKDPFGPTNIAGAPGVILEVGQTKNNVYWIAEKIERVDVQIILPKDGKFITKEEYLDKYAW